MAGKDIFVSYASEDRDRIMPLVRALETTGWSVFWDRTIPTGKTWRQVIGEEIRDCRSIVVVWSEGSVESEWVQEEAEEGKRRQVLFPVRIDDVAPPFGFGSIQAADLRGWDGATSAPPFQRLVADIAALLGPPPKQEEEKRRAEEQERQRAEEAARKAEEEKRRQAQAARKAKEEEERRRAEEVTRKAEEERRRHAEDEAARKAKEDREHRLAEEAAARKAEQERRQRTAAEAARTAKEEERRAGTTQRSAAPPMRPRRPQPRQPAVSSHPNHLKVGGIAIVAVAIAVGVILIVTSTRAPITGSLEVSANVEGAVVYLNEKTVGVTPYRGNELEPGSYGVRVEKEGYKQFSQQVDVRAGAVAEVQATLRPAPPPAPTTGSLEVRGKKVVHLRNTPRDDLSNAEVVRMIKEYDFYVYYEAKWGGVRERANPGGKGIDNDFVLQKGGRVVLDRATGVMWQQSGSEEEIPFALLQDYIDELNRSGFAGFTDWRLPTVEEAMSLVEPEEARGSRIDSIFDETPATWTSDTVWAGTYQYAWIVLFLQGYPGLWGTTGIWSGCLAKYPEYREEGYRCEYLRAVRGPLPP